jgi:hypothetical protein
MISLRQHIKFLEYIQLGKSPETIIEEMKPLEALDFSRSSENTYPIKEKIKQPKTKKRLYTNVHSLVLGQFIMLEQIITGKTKLADHLVDLEIAKLIIRPANNEVFDNDDVMQERQNQEDILDMDVREVYWVLDKFIENRNKILFKDFAGVFYDLQDDAEKEEQEEEDKTSDMLFSQQWYWYSIVRNLANEDVTKYEEIYMLPMSTVLPEMSYLAQKSKIESARQRQQQAMNKL